MRRLVWATTFGLVIGTVAVALVLILCAIMASVTWLGMQIAPFVLGAIVWLFAQLGGLGVTGKFIGVFLFIDAVVAVFGWALYAVEGRPGVQVAWWWENLKGERNGHN